MKTIGFAMRFDVFTLFPEVFEPYLQASILQRARQRGLVEVHLHNIRDWTSDRHHVTDDEPYGGGGGMVMKPEPVFAAVEGVLGVPPACPVILLTPQGRLFNQAVAQELAAPAVALARLRTQAAIEAARRSFEGEVEPAAGPESSEPEELVSPLPRLALLCGRYEGVDERVRQHLATDEISIGDYVLSGGELAALVVIDAVTRLIPGVLGAPEGAQEDSHAYGLLEYPHYTRPPEFRGWKVPEVLLSGDHGRIARWRREQSLQRTYQRRPDLLQTAPLIERTEIF
jgi:tRNA (guanine37-N1)-methyltransferase